MSCYLGQSKEVLATVILEWILINNVIVNKDEGIDSNNRYWMHVPVALVTIRSPLRIYLNPIVDANLTLNYSATSLL